MISMHQIDFAFNNKTVSRIMKIIAFSEIRLSESTNLVKSVSYKNFLGSF